jgi:8-oxo-dGTP pyrophosphatase MutT (NUDIX family)
VAGIAWADSYLGRLRASAGDHGTLLFVGARGVLLDERRHLLLIKRRDNGHWTLPAGAMELGENIAECAVREVWEETGLRPTSLAPFAMYTGPAYTHTNMFGHTYQLFHTAFQVHSWDGELQRETDETVDAAFFPLDALPVPTSPMLQETLGDLGTFEHTGRLVLK